MFAVKETLASERQGKDIWFKFHTIIGPCYTDKPAERALFEDVDTAKKCSAMRHTLSFCEVADVGDEAAGDLNWNQPAPRTQKRRTK